ncbi:MAG: phosphate/phosphite/phosphonate ABC transporter substrate-binding protein [Lactobacillaceae bacterium]|nr:phosphate/phosphite/phosphonate ABC transporter substrate-binding protein [Lactobacillaceae bacterium]
MKKFVAGAAVALTLAGTTSAAFTALSDVSTSAADKTLTIGFVPSNSADTMEARAKPLAKLLTKKLGRTVKVVVSTDYNAIVEAIGSKQLDAGFLPPDAYVEAHKQYGAKLLLQSARYSVNKEDGKPTDKLVNWYKSEILVRADSDIKTLADLKGKTIATQDVSSSSGYIFPVYWLNSKKGIDVTKDATLQTVKGHDQGVLAVENKQADAAFVFQDARNIVSKDIPDIFKDTKVLALTGKIPNDTVTARKGLTKKLRTQITDALLNISKSKEGKTLIHDLYSIDGFKKGKDSNFDVVREATKFVSKNS